MNLMAFFSHPIITALRYGQLLIAICLYCYFALSGLQSSPLAYSDSALHFLGNIFIFMSFWLATCLRFKLYFQFFVTLPFAAFIEVAQIFSASRQFDLNDMLFNFLGLGVGIIICFFIKRTFLNTQLHNK